MSNYQGYHNQNVCPWPGGIEPFGRQQNMRLEMGPMPNFEFNPGFNRPLPPISNCGPNPMQQYPQRTTLLPNPNVPFRENDFMPMPGPPEGFQNYGFNNNNSMPWPNGPNERMNTQTPQFDISQNCFQNTNPIIQGPKRNQWRNNSTKSGFAPKNKKMPQSKHSKKGEDNRPAMNKNAKWQSRKPANKLIPIQKMGPFFCQICNMSFSPHSALVAHMKSSEHNRQKQLQQNQAQKNKRSRTRRPDPTLKNKPKTMPIDKKANYCTLCQKKFTGTSIDHMASDEHKVNKAIARPFCTQCQQFFRSPARFVSHCNSAYHKSGKAYSKKSDDCFIQDEFFTLDTTGISDFNKEEKQTSKPSGVREGKKKQPKRKGKAARILGKIRIDLPAGVAIQDPPTNTEDADDAEKVENMVMSDIPVVSISHKNGIETKNVNLKPGPLERDNAVKVSEVLEEDGKAPEVTEETMETEEENAETKKTEEENEEAKEAEEANEETKETEENEEATDTRPLTKEENILQDCEAALESIEPSIKENTEIDRTEKEPVGVSFIVPVRGYYCELCEEFFRDQHLAKYVHCQSEEHHRKYKDIKVDDPITLKIQAEV